MLISRSLRVASVLAATGICLAAAPSSAFHTHLEKSSPAANDTVASPASLKLWFSEKVELPFTRVTLKNVAGVAQPLGALAYADTSANAAVVAPVTAKLEPGEYTVSWSAAAKDGHPAKGKFSFVVK
jgi:methionine-rich copper-binding protein CopC